MSFNLLKLKLDIELYLHMSCQFVWGEKTGLEQLVSHETMKMIFLNFMHFFMENKNLRFKLKCS